MKSTSMKHDALWYLIFMLSNPGFSVCFIKNNKYLLSFSISAAMDFWIKFTN